MIEYLQLIRNRVKFLLAGAVFLMTLIIYFLAIPLTQLGFKMQTLNSENIDGNNQKENPFELKGYLTTADPLHLLAEYGKDLELSEVSEPEEKKFEEGFMLHSQRIQVEGKFFQLLTFQYQIDTMKSNCRVQELKISKPHANSTLKAELTFFSLNLFNHE